MLSIEPRTRLDMVIKLRSLREQADELLVAAMETDDPNDWDSWKEADGLYYGYQDAMADAFDQVA